MDTLKDFEKWLNKNIEIAKKSTNYKELIKIFYDTKELIKAYKLKSKLH